MYDGSHYYYLPWGQTKPCVMLNSQWEDVMFRIESLNLICRTIDRLVRAIFNIFILGFLEMLGSDPTYF